MVIQRRAKTSTKSGTNKIGPRDNAPIKDAPKDDAPKDVKKKVQVNFKVDQDLLKKLRALADRDSRNLSSLLLKIVKDYIESI